MPWVHFIADFDFSPKARGGRVTIAYRAGMKKNVTRECSAAAIAAARAVSTERPHEDQKPRPAEAEA